jgi:hypothetical protein
MFPEQYSHPLVGKRVGWGVEQRGVVLRVFQTRFGLLAAIDTLPSNEAVAVADLRPEIEAAPSETGQ